MAKAATLDIDLDAPAHVPPAATAARKVKEETPKAKAPKNDTPVNFRWPASEVKAMKQAAIAADMTMQDFLLSCFHAYTGKESR